MRKYQRVKKHINELHLLLIYMNSWEEDDVNNPGKKILKSWKAFTSETLHQLESNNFIYDHKGTQLLSLTKRGVRIAKKLKQKYLYSPP